MEHFAEILTQYLYDVKGVQNEASKSFYFLKFIQDVFSNADIGDSRRLFPYLEKYLKTKSSILGIKGRPDALLGNLIIEFKDELTRNKLNIAKEGLKKYFSIIWNNEVKKPRYLLLATDGVQIIVYRPNFLQMKLIEDKNIEITPDRIGLEKISEIKLDKVNYNDVYIWLDRYFLSKELQKPSTENFLNIFGKERPVYDQSIGILNEKWMEINEYPHIKIMFEEWEKYLEIVYGSRIGGLNLFLRHTYLAILSKLMATIFYSNGAFPSPEDTLKTISGEAFQEWGINNFLEYDFFSWVLRAGEEFALKFSRHMIVHLRLFDLENLTEDILKGLYQELIDPEERHDLGEYYTPDWLAYYMTEELLEKIEGSVLDPACGSGTFLMSVIRKKIKFYEEKGFDKNNILQKILSEVYGIDVHPLAVIISKVNYLLALGDLIRYKEQPVIIPVYLADSIKLPKYEKVLEGVEIYNFHANGEELLIPAKVVKSSLVSDKFFSYIKNSIDNDIPLDDIEEQLKIVFEDVGLDNGDYKVILSLYEKLCRFKDLGKDTIWTYILKNIYKPIFLSERKFTYLIGNPPWISYRYFGGEYQSFLKFQMILKYKLLPSDKVELMTHLEFGTLFFIRATDLFLENNGKIGFVMPRGIFSGDQHSIFRTCEYNLEVGIEKIYDLINVRPLFKIPSCVIFGKKGIRTNYPINGIKFSGNLSRKNESINEANQILIKDEKKYYLNKIGNRNFIYDNKYDINLGRSYYLEYFSQGATLVPRNFWFVDIRSHPRFGVNPNKPYVVTSKLGSKYAKPPYKEVTMEGVVEREYLYATLRGSELVPFGHLPFLVTVIPVIKTSSSYKMLKLEHINNYIHEGIRNWVLNSEAKWNELKSDKTKENCIEWLNYRNKIEIQNVNKRYKILYITSGTYLASCVLDMFEEDMSVIINNVQIILNGYIADTKTYYYETNNCEEAIYLTTILNSPIIDNMIKGMQSRGDFGPRDIHKKVLELPIPRYDGSNDNHKKLVEIGIDCIEITAKVLPNLHEKYISIGKIRSIIRDTLYDELEKTSSIIPDILSTENAKGTLERFFIES